jgi:hemolysin III
MVEAPPVVPPGLQRIRRYIEWCDEFRCPKPLHEASAAFRHLDCHCLRLPPSTTVGDLLAVCEVLRYDNVITTLDLSGVPIGDVGAMVVGGLLSQSTSLRVLNMANCGLGETGALVLLKGVALSPALERINLSNNALGLQGAVALGRILRRTRTLAFVDISRCWLGRQGVQEVTNALVMRAQRRLDYRARQQLAPNVQPRSSPGRAASSSIEGTLEAALSRPMRALDSAQGLTLFGALFGEVSEVVVRTDASVRTIWKKGPSIGADKGTLVDDDDIDIEVALSGNLVAQETLNASVHAFGLLLSLMGSVPILKDAAQSGVPWRLFGVSTFIAASATFLAIATSRHSLGLVSSTAVSVLRVLDHSAAFVLIAASFTPFCVVNLPMPFGFALLATVWLIAMVGVVLSTTCGHSLWLRRVRLLLYFAAGWLALVPYLLARPCLPTEGWYLLAAAGSAFTVGIGLYSVEMPRADESIFSAWYVMLLAALLSVTFCVHRFVAVPSAACFDAVNAWGLSRPLSSAALGMDASIPAALDMLGVREALAAVQAAAVAATADGRRVVIGVLREALERLEKGRADGDL